LGRILVKLNVNGEEHEVAAKPHWTLLYVLREELGLTGTKVGCNTGDCGACTVLLDGKAVRSCLVPVAQAEGKKVVTIEGLSDGMRLHPLQEAFIEYAAVQCGFCTPGMILTAKAFLDEHQGIPTEEEVKEAIGGNTCRCTGYVKIVEAVIAASKVKRGAK
jgi:aerobic carbon-monoxide dehydrogenase small subunit